MPLNSLPVTTDRASLEAKRRAARGKCCVDVGFYGGLTPESGAELAALLGAGVLGIKVFLCPSGLDQFAAVERRHIESALPLLRLRGVPLLAHCELVDDQVPKIVDRRSYREYSASRPERFEQRAIRLLAEEGGD